MAYSELRSGLIMSSDGALASILAAPAIPFEAGPAVAANLALSIANTGRKTLLIDCDLQGRALSELMELEGKPGLSDALQQEEDFRERIVAGEVANLSFLPAGEKSTVSTDLLSKPFFLEELREQEDLFDEVVLYGPPLLGSLDSAVVGALVDAVMVVIDADRCTRKAATEAMHGFERLGIMPLGSVLANVKMRGRERPRAEGEKIEEPAAVSAKKKRKPPKEKVAAPAAAAAAPPVKEKKRWRKERQAPPPAPVPPPTTLEPVRPAAAAEVREKRAAPRPDLREPSRPAPSVTSSAAEAEDELQHVRESVSEDFRRMGEKGAPIPKNWLRALNSDKPEERESAESAIPAYYRSFLRRYNIGEDSVSRITASIIMMMRREGEFAAMSEEQAQRRLQQMLVEAGASLSTTPEAAAGTLAEKSGEPSGRGAASKSVEKELRKQEKKRFRLEVKGGKKAAKEKGKAYRELSGEEESIDWE
jgi:Mrp family chromosome partitioning ATPase